MRRLVSLLIGLGVAVLLGWLYMKFSGPLVVTGPAPTPAQLPEAKSEGSNALLFAVVLFSWITAFTPMPSWLAALLDIAFGWVGMAVFAVSGVFVLLAAPHNTLQDTTYVAFLCSIAIVIPRLGRILRAIGRGEGD